MIKIVIKKSGAIKLTPPKKKHTDIVSRLQRSQLLKCVSDCLVAFTDTEVEDRRVK